MSELHTAVLYGGMATGFLVSLWVVMEREGKQAMLAVATLFALFMLAFLRFNV